LSGPPTSTTTTDYADDYTGLVYAEDRYVRGARWARTGLLNAKGQPILRRLELPIGFAPYDPLDMYAIEDLE
jgi:hypothetical protein